MWGLVARPRHISICLGLRDFASLEWRLPRYAIFIEMGSNLFLKMKILPKYGAWVAGVFFVVAPAVVFAAAPTIPTILETIASILNAVIPLIIGLAFIVFLWGVYKYVTTASLDGKEGARATIIYGLIGLFVMLAAWGLVNILIRTFLPGTPVTAPPWIPEIVLPLGSSPLQDAQGIP